VLETLTIADAVELAIVERNGFVESRHAGAAVVLSADGDILAQHGDAEALILPRSSLKPLQAIAAVTAGAALEGEQLALGTASHSGTDRHVEVVREMLSAGGLNEDDLGCPVAWPSDATTRRDMIRDHADRARVRMNCSGKHALMLRACVATGWPTEGYLDPAHPLQVHIREVVERLAGEKIAHTSIDGSALRCTPSPCSDSPVPSTASARRRSARRSPCTVSRAPWCAPCGRIRGRSPVPASPTPSPSRPSACSPSTARKA